ncbi:MAG: pyrroloquinoline quinone biosynthesis protein PqqB [Sneathiella sp.]|nr:pyrroloquinoline quinone biosynthesis protein PqqB [Sneathiella sp.]
MKIIILGAAAGGGFPQWNCNCSVCATARRDPELAKPRTQSSLAISVDGKHWFLMNASPDLRQQISENRPLWPHTSERRGSGISGVILTNGDVDHICGLVNLRESQRLNLYATRRILESLAANKVFDVLNPDFVGRHQIVLNQTFEPVNPDGTLCGLTITPFAVPGKVALYLEDTSAGDNNFGSQAEDTIGLKISSSDTGTCFYYVPGCAKMSVELADRLRDASLVFFDGTLWEDTEMIEAGVGIKTGQRMGHMSMSGESGTLAAFATLNVDRKIFVHINNTNPVLLEKSNPRFEAEAAGWEIGYDGMEISL